MGTYATPSTMAPPQGASGTFAQGVAPAQNGNVAYSGSAVQQPSAQALFDQLDVNGSGGLSLQEFKSLQFGAQQMTEQLIASNQTQFSQPVSPVSPAVTNTYGANANMTYAAPPTTAPQGVASAQNMTYAAPSAMAPPQGASGTFVQGVAPAQDMTYAAPCTTAPEGVAPAQNMTYAAAPTMAPPQGGSGTFVQGIAPAQNITSGTFAQGVAPAQNMAYAATSTMAPSQVGSGTLAQGVAPAQNMTYAAPSGMALPQVGSGSFAQGVAPAQNMTYEAVGAAPHPVSNPPVTYAAPPSLPATDTAIETGKVTETVTKVVAGAAPPVVIATPLPNSPRASRSANSDEFKTQVKEAVSHGDEMITIPTKMAVGLLEKGIPEADPSEMKPLKVTKSRRTGGCC